MPVAGVSCETGDLQPQHDASATHANLCDEPLETFAVGSGRTGLAKVAIDHDHAIARPSESYGALPQRVLSLRALRVLDDLSQSGLTHVQIGVAFEMTRGHIGARRRFHPDTS